MHVIMFPLVVCSNHCMIFFFPFNPSRPCFLRWSSWVYSQQRNVTVVCMYIYVFVHTNIQVYLYVYRCCIFMIYLNSRNSSGFRWKTGHRHLKSVWHDRHPSETAEIFLLHPEILPQVFTCSNFQARTWKKVVSPFILKREGSSFIRNSSCKGMKMQYFADFENIVCIISWVNAMIWEYWFCTS